MYFKRVCLISGLLITLSGCTSATPPAPVRPSHPVQSVTTDPVRLVPGTIQNSTSNSCIDDMYLLRKINNESYRVLAGKYNDVMNEFNFLRENENIMDDDIKIYMRNSLTIKLGKVCSDIKLSAFKSIKKKTNQFPAT